MTNVLYKKYLLSIALLFLFTSPVYANIGVPTIYLLFPQAFAALVPIILIESYFIKKQFNVEYSDTVFGSFVMNAVSTIVGVPLTWFLVLIFNFLVGYIAYQLNNPLLTEFPTFLGVIILPIVSAAWLPPSVKYWQISLSLLVLLVPFFYMSYCVEFFIAKKMYKNFEQTLLKKVLFKANLTTYSLTGIYIIIDLLIRLMNS